MGSLCQSEVDHLKMVHFEMQRVWESQIVICIDFGQAAEFRTVGSVEHEQVLFRRKERIVLGEAKSTCTLFITHCLLIRCITETAALLVDLEL